MTTDSRLRVVRKLAEPAHIPVHDERAEAAIIGCVLAMPETISRVRALGITAKHFYRRRHELMFIAVSALCDKASPVDQITLESELVARDWLPEIGGSDAIQNLFNVVPTASNVEMYCAAVKKLYQHRCRDDAAREALRYLEDRQYERAAELFRLAARPVDEVSDDNPLITEIADSPFCVWNGQYAKREFTKTSPKQELQPTPLTNFTAAITANEWADDGTGQSERRIRLSIRMSTGEQLAECAIKAEDWKEISAWLPKHWGHRPVMHVQPDVVRRAIALQHQTVPERRFYTHTGWTKAPNGEMVYLLHGGPVAGSPEAIASVTENCDVSVDPKIQRWQLPREAATAEAVTEAYMWIERFLEVGDKKATLPIMALQFLAPLTSILRPNLAVWLAGRSGSRKTSLVCAAMGLWGSDVTGRRWRFDDMPIAWLSTSGSMLELGFQGKDLPLVFDNFVPDQFGKEQVKLNQVAYAIGDGANRDRLNANAGMKTARPVRGLVLSTGEDTPQGEGQSNRFYVVSMYDTSTKSMALEEVQEAGWAGKMQPAMKHYLEWLAPRVADPTWVKKVQDRFYFLTKQGRRMGAAHMRLPEQAAWVRIGLELILSSNPTKKWTNTSMPAEIDTALAESTMERNATSQESRLSFRFCSAVQYMIQTGLLVGTSRDLKCPDREPELFGWRPFAHATDVIEMGEKPFVKRFPGAQDGVFILEDGPTWFVGLDPKVVFFLMKEKLMRACPINESLAGVRRALISDQLLAAQDGDGHVARQVRLSGSRRERLWMVHGPRFLEMIGAAPDSPIVRVDEAPPAE